LIKNGRVIDPSQNLDAKMVLLIEGGVVKMLAAAIDEAADEVFDADGLVIAPGLIDVHTHLREPGLEAKEDIITGTHGSGCGGVTTIACMPNTKPVVDSSILVSGIKDRAARKVIVNVEVVGAITKGLGARSLPKWETWPKRAQWPFRTMAALSQALAFSLWTAQYISSFDKILISHSIDPNLTPTASCMKELFPHASACGSSGAHCRGYAVARDILVAKYTKTHIHIALVASKDLSS
jgi:dihydroorotase